MSGKLSQRAAESARPRSARYEIKDSRLNPGGVSGLKLVVTPTGVKTWQIRLWVNGKQKSGTVGDFPEMNLDAARARAGEVASAAKLGRWILAEPSQGKETVEAYIADYRASLEGLSAATIKLHGRFVKKMPKSLLECRMDALTPEMITAWKKENDHRRQWWNKSGVFLHNVWEWAVAKRRIPMVDHQYRSLDPFKGVKYYPKNASPGKRFTDEELVRIFQAIDEAEISRGYKLGITILFATGCRPGEVFSLFKRQVDLAARRIHLQLDGACYQTKTRKARSVVIAEEIVPLFVELLAGDGELLFPSEFSGTGYLTDWAGAWAKVRAIAGVEGRLYDARHDVASATKDALGVHAAALALGHSSTRTTVSTYIHPHAQAEEVAAGLRGARIAALRTGQPVEAQPEPSRVEAIVASLSDEEVRALVMTLAARLDTPKLAAVA